ncbi:excinuclease ABC subunit UvrA [Candidatus Dojkabacteria bacterium]|uniref:UvrABC system protein A n=1 Tax=Candidatus Dojkabacteria bacterium TaxID=2099670 RepID=A0A3M0Z147_9BACT|nr:MAG: excinuclease ABC subunit UvrA [Candidatus Dojkabacteria bacterium]
MEFIKVRGARTHNLKNVDVDIPKNKLVVFTGLSGSGKSSLAFDTIYAEGQRRYVESLSSYARQFLGLMDKPDVDSIEGLSPAISIDQKSSGHNPRSTVGTVTEIYDYLRLLYAKVGHPRSPFTGERLQKQTVQEIVDKLSIMKNSKLLILAPVVKGRKGTYEELFSRFLSLGYIRARVDGKIYNLEEEIKLDKNVKHYIEIVVDRIQVTDPVDNVFIKRITDSVEQALNIGDGELLVNVVETSLKRDFIGGIRENGDIYFSEKLVDPYTGLSVPKIEPNTFSFNSPHGACEKCGGLGFIKEIDESLLYNPRLTILEGGIFPWARSIENKNSYMFKLLNEVSKRHDIDIRAPIGNLSESQLQVILYGDTKKYSVEFVEENGQKKVLNVAFEGVVPHLLRKYNETDSEYVRSEIEQYMVEKKCDECRGYRLKRDVLSVTINGLNIVDVGEMSILQALEWTNSILHFKKLSFSFESILSREFGMAKVVPENDVLSNQEKEIAKQIIKEIQNRLNFMISVGLGYLTLNRSARTLSGGESQRIRLASQIGTGLTGVLYVLDEPSIGLHQRDNARLIKTLENLRDMGNTVIVVEHDEDTIRKADYIVDIGPLAGDRGGSIVFSGEVKDIKNAKNSLTADYLTGKKRIDKKEIYEEIEKLGFRRFEHKEQNYLRFFGIKHNNLKNIDLEIPLGKFICVTGVSGSGKSSLINDVVNNYLAKMLFGSKETYGAFKEMRGIEYIDKLVNIDQSPIGKTPRSNPATYTGVFSSIREIFAETKESKVRGYKSGRFSFNVKGGRCEKCEGAGVIKISMQFLPDVYVTCEECGGHRYNRETLQIDYKGKNISEVLNMTIEEGVRFFSNISSISSKLKTLMDVGLGYLKLGQPATTLSGGESQRVKLAAELSKKQTGKTLYILDEPTTGLHFEDVRKLLVVLHGLVYCGNTVIVIEHNLDLIKTADWIIDLGPEGGDEGGQIVAQGSVEDIVKVKESYTGQWLVKVLNKT